ncbi:MAG TPA: hypothetical protein VHD81_07630 [Mycobacteriales bacterium]|nr:hypothetical protein [Mycobacteriales bacterium]
MSALRRLGVLGVAAAAGVLAIGTAVADSGPPTTTHTVVVHDDIEAWYQSLPISICGTPIGCPPPLPLPVPGPSTIYPEGTLHVGVALGIELSRTYLRPSLYSLPPGAVLTGGVMTVPLINDLKAGTINAGGADMKACLVTAPVTDGIQGALEDPPESNCNVSSKVAATAKGDAFTVDLAPFIAAWRSGKSNFGVVLLPDTSKLSVWQVALAGRGSAGGQRVTYSLTYSVPSTGTGIAVTPPPVPSPPPAPVIEPPPVIPPAVTTTAPPVQPPLIAQPQAVTQPFIGFKYPAVFLVPLAFLFGLLFLGRTFTRDATPLNAVAGAARRRDS